MISSAIIIFQNTEKYQNPEANTKTLEHLNTTCFGFLLIINIFFEDPSSAPLYKFCFKRMNVY